MIDTLNILLGAFVTAALGLVVYLIQLVYSYKMKKAELDYSFFQEHKIKAVIKFFDDYGEVEQAWQKFPIWRMLESQIKVKELDDIIDPIRNKLRLSVINLTLFFNKGELDSYRMVIVNLDKLHDFVGLLFIGKDPDERKVDVANAFHNLLEDVKRDNELILRIIGHYSQKHFYKGNAKKKTVL